MKHRRGVASLLLVAAVSLGGFCFPAWARKKPLQDTVWVVVRPVTCLGNPWEKDWLARHKNRSDKYPQTKEASILKAFFKRKGSPVLDLRVKPYMKGDPLCQTCDCSRGDTLYLLVSGEAATRLTRFGYTERIPSEAVPKQKPSDD